MKTLILILILFQIRNLLACLPPAPTPKPGDGRLQGNPSKWVAHWSPPWHDSLNNYKNWMDDYNKKKQKILDDYEAAHHRWPDKPADAGGDWPKHWKGVRPGTTGENPPPWAYVEKSRGKADQCFLNPDKGNCTDYSIRWGFNPYVDDCREFVYGGCGGNFNNFVSQARCKEECVGAPPVANCVAGAGVHMDYYDFPDLPKTEEVFEG